jgi:hypothetical protein
MPYVWKGSTGDMVDTDVVGDIVGTGRAVALDGDRPEVWKGSIADVVGAAVIDGAEERRFIPIGATGARKLLSSGMRFWGTSFGAEPVRRVDEELVRGRVLVILFLRESRSNFV